MILMLFMSPQHSAIMPAHDGEIATMNSIGSAFRRSFPMPRDSPKYKNKTAPVELIDLPALSLKSSYEPEESSNSSIGETPLSGSRHSHNIFPTTLNDKRNVEMQEMKQQIASMNENIDEINELVKGFSAPYKDGNTQESSGIARTSRSFPTIDLHNEGSDGEIMRRSSSFVAVDIAPNAAPQYSEIHMISSRLSESSASEDTPAPFLAKKGSKSDSVGSNINGSINSNRIAPNNMVHHPFGDGENESASHRQHTYVNPPTLPLHSRQELELAERCLKRLVIGSSFFPRRAAKDDWFRRASSEMSGDQEQCVPLLLTAKDDVATQTGVHVTTLYEHEVCVEKLLGRGGFCEVRFASIRGGSDQDETANNTQCYAIKYLSPNISEKKGKKAFSRGAADLVIEARFLSSLRHKNIIQLHHVSAGSLRACYNCLDTREDDEEWRCCSLKNNAAVPNQRHLRHFGYFLMLDLLCETLDYRLKHTYVDEVISITGEHPSKHHDHHRCHTPYRQRHWWTHDEDANEPAIRSMKKLLLERLGVLRSVASAIEFLHDHRIIFRDIKPDNIGFDEHGIPKLFDFGLVKELKPSSRVASLSCNRDVEDALYKLTPKTGSRRYMSPEVAFSEPYNYKVDTYSFGILIYEMATLITPFEGYTINRHETEVLAGGRRPCLSGYTHWPKDLVHVINDSWSSDMIRRPKMGEVLQRLDKCIEELSNPVAASNNGFANNLTVSPRSILAGLTQLHLPSKSLSTLPSLPVLALPKRDDSRLPRKSNAPQA